jgi:putative ABC transport system permease protein
MGTAWSKVWRDLAHNKARTILVVLSTAVGVFSLGLVFGMSDVMRTRMWQAHRDTVTAHITFRGGPYTQDTIEAIRREPGVLDAQGETRVSLRWKPAGADTWKDADLIVRSDYEDQRMELVRLVDGRWPEKRTLAMERLSARGLNLVPGSTVLIQHGQREREVPISGIVRVHVVFPPQWGGWAIFCVTPETADWLVGRQLDFSALQVRLDSFSQAGVEDAAKRIEDRLERMGLAVDHYEITDPNVHWLQGMVDGTLLILGVLGVLALGLSAFLIINTMSAIMAQEVWQIGVMKTVGATLVRLLRVYLMMALFYGVAALIIAVPSGIIGAHWMAAWLLDLLNIVLDSFEVSTWAVALQIAVGMSVPLLAGLVPVLSGACITAREAISTHGIGMGFGSGWFDRLIGRVRRLPRPLALSLRNTFRRKVRVALTLLTLTLSGVMFMMTMSVERSLFSTLESGFDQLGNDLSVHFDHPHRIERLVGVAESVPGVLRAEVWNRNWATLPLESGEELAVYLQGVPADSTMFRPQLAGGRGLVAGDTHAVVINNKLAIDEGIGVGDEIVLSIGEEEAVWTVVGIALSTNINSNELFVPFHILAQATGTTGRGAVVRIICGNEALVFQQQLITALREAYEVNRLEVTGHWCSSEGRAQNRASFGTTVILLLSMATLTAAVGSIGLMSTMSISVVERRREIGVMRAVGASSVAVAGIFVAEGVFLGLLSWLLAIPISVPGARLFSDAFGAAVMSLPLEFVYSVDGALLWLGIVVVLSALASLWPALRASRVSVREALAYE